jgi:hypothetical protein
MEASKPSLPRRAPRIAGIDDSVQFWTFNRTFRPLCKLAPLPLNSIA